MKKHITVIAAEYVEGYKVRVFFSDDTKRVVDFESFLRENPHPSWNKYLKITEFKKFKIESGQLVWGKDWDLIFPIDALYRGDLNINCDAGIKESGHSYKVY